MSHPKPIVSLADYKAKKEEQGSVPIDIGDGDVIYTRSPWSLPDEDMKALAKADTLDDVETVARIILGDNFDRFIAAGGTSTLLASILDEHGSDLIGPSPES